jgi:ABC transporter with metal-binding/Fe-S-binding domain ATP-binding protein
MIPQKEDSWMFHYPNMHLMDLIAEAVAIPLVKAETSGIKEEEIKDLKQVIAGLSVEGIVSGAIASSYQKTRIEKLCKQLKLECLAPLWHENPLEILKEILELGFETMITGVCAYGFDKEWLGRRIDKAAFAELIELNKRYGISIVGEGGEYETLVLDSPFFRKRLRIIEAEKVWKGQSGYFLVTKAELEPKPTMT